MGFELVPLQEITSLNAGDEYEFMIKPIPETAVYDEHYSFSFYGGSLIGDSEIYGITTTDVVEMGEGEDIMQPNKIYTLSIPAPSIIGNSKWLGLSLDVQYSSAENDWQDVTNINYEIMI